MNMCEFLNHVSLWLCEIIHENKLGYLMYNYTAISDGFGSVEQHLFVPKEFSEGLSEHNRLPTHC